MAFVEWRGVGRASRLWWSPRRATSTIRSFAKLSSIIIISIIYMQLHKIMLVYKCMSYYCVFLCFLRRLIMILFTL